MNRADRVVRVGQSAIGQGVFANSPFEPEEVIGRIAGSVSDDPNYSSDYCMKLGDGLTLEPDPPFKFLNHSCEPNCSLVHVGRPAAAIAAARKTMYVQALRAIAVGDELTIDYAWPAEYAVRCQCGTANCRGWVVGIEHLPLVAETSPPPKSCEERP